MILIERIRGTCYLRSDTRLLPQPSNRLLDARQPRDDLDGAHAHDALDEVEYIARIAPFAEPRHDTRPHRADPIGQATIERNLACSRTTGQKLCGFFLDRHIDSPAFGIRRANRGNRAVIGSPAPTSAWTVGAVRPRSWRI